MGEVVSLEQEPPSDLAVDTRGLPPARARLARFIAWAQSERAALERLNAGRREIAKRIAAGEAEVQREAAAVDADAQSIVESVRRGIAWSFDAFRPRPVEVGPALSVEKAALGKISASIETKRAEIASIEDRQKPALRAALIETAKSIVRDYESALRAAAEAAARLEGLSVFLEQGRQGRTVGAMPAFRLIGDETDERPVPVSSTAIQATARVWRAFAETLAADPRADVTKHLRFPAAADAPEEALVYHELSPAERRLVDARFAANA
jgi:hypothetical protein